MAFDNMGDKTDGLMAERSIGHEQGKVNGDLFQLSSNRRREFVFDVRMPADTAHERHVNRRQASHDLPRSETRQGGHGKDDFRVSAGHWTNARVVIDHNRARLRIGRNEPIS